MSTIAVTGASGFLGRHVVAELSGAGHSVRRLGRGPEAKLVDLDRRDDVSPFAGVDRVAHLAGMLAAHPGTPVSHYLDANVALTEQVMLDAVAAGSTSFVFASSRLVYPSNLGRSATESDTPSPDGTYGLSKRFAEQVVEHHARLGSIAATSLRVSQLIGPGDGDRGALARFASAARAGDSIEVLGRGVAVRDVLDVRDAARAVRLALDAADRGHTPPAMNVGGGPSTIRELAEVAATAAGRTTDEITHKSVEVEDDSHWSLDCSLASDAMGWTPCHTLVGALVHRWASDSGADDEAS